MAWPGSVWLLLTFSSFPVRHPIGSPCSVLVCKIWVFLDPPPPLCVDVISVWPLNSCRVMELIWIEKSSINLRRVVEEEEWCRLCHLFWSRPGRNCFFFHAWSLPLSRDCSSPPPLQSAMPKQGGAELNSVTWHKSKFYQMKYPQKYMYSSQIKAKR